jgi:hypothetical protein
MNRPYQPPPENPPPPVPELEPGVVAALAIALDKEAPKALGKASIGKGRFPTYQYGE